MVGTTARLGDQRPVIKSPEFIAKELIPVSIENRIAILFGPESQVDPAKIVVDFAKETTPRDIVTVIATKPLTDNETWNVMQRGSLAIFRDGSPAVVA